MNNLLILNHTLKILKQGKYQTSDNRELKSKWSPKQMESATEESGGFHILT